MGKPKGNKCGLCHVKKKKWGEKGFYGIECRKCNVPMIILRDHRAELTPEEETTLAYLEKEYYSHLKPRRKGIRSQKDHWHEHYIK